MSTQRTARGSQRKRHVPQRSCIACRHNDAKRGLLRIVRNAEGRVLLDPTGKQNGRGAYLCHNPRCWDQALKRSMLERALRVEHISTDDRAALAAFARSLDPAQDEGSGAADA
jgi:hypothetical protein